MQPHGDCPNPILHLAWGDLLIPVLLVDAACPGACLYIYSLLSFKCADFARMNVSLKTNMFVWHGLNGM